VFGALLSLAVLGAGVVMISVWAPPVMSAEELSRLPHRAHPGDPPVTDATTNPEGTEEGVEPA
jgi:hypothetical protein